MKIVTFSDIHGQQNKALTEWFNSNPADLLIFAGDLQLNNLDYGESFIKWIHQLPYTNKVMVFGNHDGNYIHTLTYIMQNEFTDIIFLNNGSIIIDGVNIFGSPYSVKYQDWWFMLEDEKLSTTWNKIPEDTDILITHCPPFGILDYTFENAIAGSKTLLKRVNGLRNLRYHIFGHIHESYGTININGKTFINACLLNEKYQLVNNPIIFDYDIEQFDIYYNVGE